MSACNRPYEITAAEAIHRLRRREVHHPNWGSRSSRVDQGGGQPRGAAGRRQVVGAGLLLDPDVRTRSVARVTGRVLATRTGGLHCACSTLTALRDGDFGERLYQDIPIRVADAAKLLDQYRLPQGASVNACAGDGCRKFLSCLRRQRAATFPGCPAVRERHGHRS